MSAESTDACVAVRNTVPLSGSSVVGRPSAVFIQQRFDAAVSDNLLFQHRHRPERVGGFRILGHDPLVFPVDAERCVFPQTFVKCFVCHFKRRKATKQGAFCINRRDALGNDGRDATCLESTYRCGPVTAFAKIVASNNDVAGLHLPPEGRVQIVKYEILQGLGSGIRSRPHPWNARGRNVVCADVIGKLPDVSRGRR